MGVWRNSATLILVARHGQKYNRAVAATTHNYNLLCLKRHHKSNYMPGSYVFPGGVVDPADSDVKWRECFATLGFDGSSLASLIPKTTSRPQIFHAQQNELPREISLRITAIRETFEESGVLICRHKEDGNNVSVSQCLAHHVPMPNDELQTWQSKIHKDATFFLKFCEKLQCCPDLWALHEWSNWLTPTATMNSRFDTVFYLTCMPFKPNAEYEAKEMEGLKWDTPENFLTSFDSTFQPPQKYLITELANIKNIDNLLNYAVERNKEGVQLDLPVIIQLKDGMISVLPGDTMYPKEASLLDVQLIDRTDITMAESLEMTPIKNRLEFAENGFKVIVSDNLPKGIQGSFVDKIGDGQPQIKNKL